MKPNIFFLFQDVDFPTFAPDFFVKLSIKLDETISMRVKEKLSVGEMKKCFCEKISIEASTIRLFLNGERLENKQTIKELNVNGKDVIEAFREISGGGPPQKKNQTYDEHQILEALNKSSDSDESEENFCENQNVHIQLDTNIQEFALLKAHDGQEINKHESVDDDKMKEIADLSTTKDSTNDEEAFSSGDRNFEKECHEEGKLDFEETEEANFDVNQNDMDLVEENENEKKKNKLKTKEN